MNNQEAIKRIKEHIAIHKYRESHAIHIVEALEMAISALRAQETHGDTISRQAAIDAVKDEWDGCCSEYDAQTIIHDTVERIEQIPSAQPEPKTGEWIDEKINEYMSQTYCSVCKGSAPFICVADDHYGNRMHGETRKTKYCPHCGSLLLGGDKNE